MVNLIQESDLQIYLDTIPDSWPVESFLLSEEELAYCLQSRNEPLQRSRAKLRLMVKEIFADYSVNVSKGPLGRPLISDDFDISFSHKKESALVGIAHGNSRLGIDIEDLNEKIDWPVFTKNFFTAVDENSIQKLSLCEGWNDHSARLCIFSLKEAFFKGIDSHLRPLELDLIFSELKNDRAYFHFSHRTTVGKLPETLLFSFIKRSNLISIFHYKSLA
jgi:phosphopantetheinyl transferase